MNNQAELNKEQLEAVHIINGPLLIDAGAGSGKTKTIIARAAYMIDNGVSPNNILMLTFTNKAANVMKERLKNIVGEKGEGVKACTFHSFFALLLRSYGNYVGIRPNYTIITGSDEKDVVNFIKAGTPCIDYEMKGFPNSKAVVDIISKSVNKNVSVAEIIDERQFSKYSQFKKSIAKLAKDIENYKRENNLVNYDDILKYCSEILFRNNNVTKHISEIYPYVMVDEYQDTNPLQESILVMLFKYTHNIAVVGDDMQALYAFRGADPDILRTYGNRYEGTKTIILSQNYRSDQGILNLANIISSNTVYGRPKELIGQKDTGYLPTVYRVDDVFDEAYVVFDEIQKRLSSGVTPNEIAVLARKSKSFAGLENILTRNGISYSKYGGVKFFDKNHVKDILAYLRVVVNQYDTIAWFRVLKIIFGIGDKYAREISSNCKINGKEALIDKKYSKRKYFPDLESLYNEIGKLHQSNLNDAVKEITQYYLSQKEAFIDKGYKSKSTREEEENLLRTVIKKDIKTLCEISEQYDNISDFLENLSLDNNPVSQDNSDEQQIVLSTIHSAKGLEFDSVIILDCVDGSFPSTDRKHIGTDEDEDELRCFYVAITRAKNHLSLYSPRFIRRYDGSMECAEISHFLPTDSKSYIIRDAVHRKRIYA